MFERQTRDHADLDLVVDVNGLDELTSALAAAGFEVLRNWLPTAITLRHGDGRIAGSAPD